MGSKCKIWLKILMQFWPRPRPHAIGLGFGLPLVYFWPC